ncbi:MAG: hypothetical protein ACOH5I_24070 [Oligoflexus sp.]
MKHLIGWTLGLAVSASAAAQTLPTAPSGCARDLAMRSYCSSYSAPPLRGPINVKFFAVVDKASYSNINSILKRYTDFENWPEYVDATGRTDILFNTSKVLKPLPATDGNGEVMRHYADYRIDSVIGYQNVRVVTHNTLVDAYDGALRSLEFTAQNKGQQEVPTGEPALNGSIGVQSQTGNVHVVDCASSELCSEDQYLLIYESTVTPDIDLLPNLAARSITRGIESLLIGMFLLGDADGDIL